MRKFGFVALTGALLFAAGTASAQDEQKAVRGILDKAISGLGGAAKAGKLSDISFKGKASFSENGMEASMTFDMSIQGFERVRLDMAITMGARTESVLLVFNGDKGWAKTANKDKVEEAPKEVVAIMQHMLLAMRAANHAGALAANKDYTLAPGGEATVGEVTAAIVRLTRKDQPEITLFFDQKSGLPLKSETRAKEPQGGEEKPYGFHFSDFKDVDGVKHFGRVKLTRDGKDLTEVELSEFKVGQKIENSTFEKP